LILYAWSQLEEAFALQTKEEALCLELDNKDGLQRSYGNQAISCKPGAGCRRSFELLKKREAFCVELGNRSGRAYCYWNWGLLARVQSDRKAEREKLTSALNIFAELNMPRQRRRGACGTGEGGMTCAFCVLLRWFGYTIPHILGYETLRNMRTRSRFTGDGCLKTK